VTGEVVAAGALQIAGVALAPLLPGTIQALKARLQGRRGASALQPYRELRRLWGKSLVTLEGSTAIYRTAPSLIAASLLLVIFLVPIAGTSPDWPIGRDALLVVGLLALARFTLAVAAWDTGGGFGLMGASRDLTISVFAEGVLLLVLVAAALPLGSTDLRSMSDAAAGSAIWTAPVHWCAAAAFGLLILVETGRQPIDNPDTHLELTMIHEGPLLEYAGRDLALLHWAAAARHWVLLVLAVDLFLPRAGTFTQQLALVAFGVVALTVALAFVETAFAKMRTLVVPLHLAAAAAVALVGLLTWFVGGRP
jgi:formate hydrogenlyase subunit 4